MQELRQEGQLEFRPQEPPVASKLEGLEFIPVRNTLPGMRSQLEQLF